MKISPIGASSWLGKYHVVLTAYLLLPGRTRVERPITVDPADGLRGEVGSVVVLVDVFSVAVVPVAEDELVDAINDIGLVHVFSVGDNVLVPDKIP